MTDSVVPAGTGRATRDVGGSGRPGEKSYVANRADLPEGTVVQLFLRAVDEYDKADALLRRKAGPAAISCSRSQVRCRRRACCGR